jgi:hypothetical protein
LLATRFHFKHKQIPQIADFSIAYADQSERDHKVLTKAVRDGRLEVVIERE